MLRPKPRPAGIQRAEQHFHLHSAALICCMGINQVPNPPVLNTNTHTHAHTDSFKLILLKANTSKVNQNKQPGLDEAIDFHRATRNNKDRKKEGKTTYLNSTVTKVTRTVCFYKYA